MQDFRGKKVDAAPPGMPVEVLGFDSVPDAGEIVRVVENEVENGRQLRDRARETRGTTEEARQRSGTMREERRRNDADVDLAAAALELRRRRSGTGFR